MGLKQTAANSYISRGSGFSNYLNHTSMCWYQSPSAWSLENTIFDIEGTGYHFCFITSGGDLQLDVGAGGLLAAALSLNTLYHITMRGDGVNVKLFVDGVERISRTNTTITGTSLEAWGGYLNSQLNAGTFSAIKQWAAVLTPDEILNEMRSYLPRRGQNLHTFVPLLDHTNLVNRAQGVGFTANGSLAFADGPPITWGGQSIIVPGVSPVLQTQEGFRFFNDDGSESASTALAAQDTNASLAPDTPKRLRMLIDAAGDPPSSAYRLQYRKVGDATWKDVL